MSETKTPSNVIQFPGGKRKEEAQASAANTPASPNETAVNTAKKPVSKDKKAKATTAGTVLAIALLTAAFNRYAFTQNVNSLDASSSSGRSIASVGHMEWKRDAAWEKNLAESLASAQVRSVASTGLGRVATAEERLRWGTLEEKYTIVYKSDVHNIEAITLQDASSRPSYILDRNRFLRDYGQLFQDGFASAKLKSMEVDHDKTVEAYTLFDKDKRPKSEAHFTLDVHKRLLSLKVEPLRL